ncbi:MULTISPECIES: heme o synthase [Salinibaculum]|uniref:heme o synthase n=1 Tax=Salinibaculum TaxID=2732368 RepID=UPI0030CEF7D4
MLKSRVHSRTTGLLSAAAVGVYLLVVAGATASLADAASACSTWPTCQGPLLESGTLVALGHRVLAAVVGVLVVAAALAVLRSDTDRRVRIATLAALVLFPAQVGFGALLATSSGAAPFPGVHLLIAVSIFGALVMALAWHLEAETGSDERIEEFDPVPAPEPATDDEAAEPTVPLSARPLSKRVTARLFAYFRLMKPRLMWLLCLVAAAGMALAAGTDLQTRTIVLTLGGGVLAIGASGTFNHVLERERDKRMDRTSDRPLATHEIPKGNAVVFGIGLAALSLAVFWQVNVLAAALGLVAILFYSVVYTLVLKPNTVQNTVIGGAAGALPALIGWAAVTGDIGVPGLALAGVIFVWTPAHFYNLALAYKDDYERGGFPMMPVVRGETETRKHILLWLGATLALTGGLIWVTGLSWLTAAATAVVGAVFLWAVVRLHREQTEAAAFRAFHASNAYLGVLLVTIVVDALAV